MIEYFLNAYLVNSEARKHFRLPYITIASFDAVCFCHKKKIKTGWVCTACLAIYCTPQSARDTTKCEFCGVTYTVFNYKELEAVD